jgi:hypothetical protein
MPANGGRVAETQEPIVTEDSVASIGKLTLLERIEGASLSKPDSTWGNRLTPPDDPPVSVKTMKINKKKKRGSKAKALASNQATAPGATSNDGNPATTEDPATAQDQLVLDPSTQLLNMLPNPDIQSEEPNVDQLFNTYINSTRGRSEERMVVDGDQFVDENGNPWEPEEQMGPG